MTRLVMEKWHFLRQMHYKYQCQVFADMQFSLIGTCGGDGGGDIGGDGGLWPDTTHRYINTIRNRIVTFTITV